jgi:hypothetical protein
LKVARLPIALRPLPARPAAIAPGDAASLIANRTAGKHSEPAAAAQEIAGEPSRATQSIATHNAVEGLHFFRIEAGRLGSVVLQQWLERLLCGILNVLARVRCGCVDLSIGAQGLNLLSPFRSAPVLPCLAQDRIRLGGITSQQIGLPGSVLAS